MARLYPFSMPSTFDAACESSPFCWMSIDCVYERNGPDRCLPHIIHLNSREVVKNCAWLGRVEVGTISLVDVYFKHDSTILRMAISEETYEVSICVYPDEYTWEGDEKCWAGNREENLGFKLQIGRQQAHLKSISKVPTTIFWHTYFDRITMALSYTWAKKMK
jgi:hypothetical protein